MRFFRNRSLAVATLIIWCGLFLMTTTTPVAAEAATIGKTSRHRHLRPNDLLGEVVGAAVGGALLDGAAGAAAGVAGVLAGQAAEWVANEAGQVYQAVTNEFQEQQAFWNSPGGYYTTEEETTGRDGGSSTPPSSALD